MYTQCFYFFFISGTTIKIKIINLRLGFFLIRITHTCVNGRPTKNSFNRPFFTMYPNSFGRGYLVVYTSISLQVNQSLFINVIDKPANFISMGFNHYFKRGCWIDNTHHCTIRIAKMGINKRL